MRLTLCLGLLITISSASSYATSLQEAINTAFEKNPITHANDLRLEAAKYRARGVNKDRLPTAGINCYQSISKYHQETERRSFENKVTDRGCDFQVDIRIFDGFAGKNQALAAAKDVEALAARNNSTNALIENTKGQLANEVYDIYMWLVEVQTYIQYNQLTRTRLEVLLKVAKTEEQKNEIKVKLANNSNGAFNLQQSYARASAAYLHVVKEMAPSQLDSFESIANSLLIPETAENAIQLAYEKSPDIIEDQKSLEAARYRRKAEVARMFSPKVDLSVSYGSTRYEESGYFSKTEGPSTYLSVRVPLGLSKRDYARAAALEISAKEKDLEVTLSDIEHSIRNDLYSLLSGYVQLSERLKRSLYKTNEDVEEVVKKAEAGQSVDIRYALSIIGEFNHQADQYVENESNLIKTKFRIQRTIGTLFDKIQERL